MLLKTYYTRFLFVFIIYLGVNLLILKIKSNDYVYVNVLNVLKSQKPVVRYDGAFNFSKIIVEKKKEVIAVTTTTTAPFTTTIITTTTTTAEETSLPISEEATKTFFINLKDNEKTLKQISQTCKENNLTTVAIKKNFFYSSKHNGLYCWIRKAGSTSFTKLFCELNDRFVTHDYYKVNAFLSPQTHKLLKNLVKNTKVFKFLAVRHPFERLVSAYRDRIEDNTRYTAQSWIYVPRIFRLTRPELQSAPISDSSQKIFYEDRRLKLIPTFGEFVKWLLQQSTDHDDPHWDLYHKHCALCTVRYDYVLKLDNYTQNEIDYVFERMNVDSDSMSLAQLGGTRGGRTNFDETCNYFKNLTHEAVVNLYERYRIDFDMFNYEFDKYFECTDGD